MGTLFGTDGIRGVANEHPLTPEFITRIGRAIGRAINRALAGAENLPAAGRASGERAIVIGRDTRLSGEMIENALAAGLMAQGFTTWHVGVLTTPGIAYLTRALGARGGISISASHNPFQDNGIKVFGPDGFKVPDALENEIETLAGSEANSLAAAPEAIGRRRDETSRVDAYVDFLLQAVAARPVFQGMHIVVDCNHGATFSLAPRVLSALGARVTALGDQPDGVNINLGYDSLEPRRLREAVVRLKANWGVQFDGDGDRSVFCDERGQYVDGDYVLAILARDWAARGRLTAGTVVSTVMANIGLEKSLKEIGGKLERTAVGDRWVTERMRAGGAQIGGEQSGHIVLFDGGHTTGDGLYTTIRMAEVLERRKASLGTLAACLTKYPQVLINVRVPSKPPLEELPAVNAQLERSQAVLGDGARILLRYSGTENLARVMIEGPEQAAIAREAEAIAAAIRQSIP